MEKLSGFDWFVDNIHNVFEDLPDSRSHSPNLKYKVKDAALGAFSVFFSQSPSFLSYQKSLATQTGESNAKSLFRIEKIPTDNQIRNILDTISPNNLYPIFSECYTNMEDTGYLTSYRFFENCLLVAIDGTEFFRSQKIHCDNRTVTKHKNGKISYSHKMLTPVITQPDSNTVIPPEPEFVTPQDGCKKQDCELNAAKRWIERNAHMADQKTIISGDDLFSKEPFCKQSLSQGFHFVPVGKPDSHKTFYEYLNGLNENDGISVVSGKEWNGKFHELISYKYCNNVPVKDGKEALHVNWAEVTVINSKTQKRIYHNSFITDFEINNANIEKIIQTGRSRWKVENENNNVLKTKGYHLEHNFGHGNMFLASTLVTLNLSAFLSHIFLEFTDKIYSSIREKVATRKTFFQDFKALTKYLYFQSRHHLMNFMAEKLELNISDILIDSS